MFLSSDSGLKLCYSLSVMTSPSEAVFLALARAEETVSRLDERVRACAFQAGWAARLDYAEATAWGWNVGQVVSSEDLVLHDQAMDVRLPDHSLRDARAFVRARRRAAGAGSGLLNPDGLAWLASPERSEPPAERGQTAALSPPTAPDPDRPDLIDRMAAQLKRLAQGMTESSAEGGREWMEILLGHELDAPALLHAALALEAWSVIDPLPRQTYLGAVMVACWLRGRRRVQTHLMGLEGGVRAQARHRRVPPASGPLARLAYWLGVIAEAAELGLAEIHRLELARQVLAQHAVARRADSRMGAAIDVLLAHPVVTAPLLAARLGVSQTAARRLIGALGSSVHEISGRARFRAWRV
jgi:hypothetical protein